jgi:hypothetical protein
MNYKNLEYLSITDLKKYASYMDLNIDEKNKKIGSPQSSLKKNLITEISNALKEYEKYKEKKEKKYKKIKQLGEPGKDGITFLVETSNGQHLAMKTFKNKKSTDEIKEESYLQSLAAKKGISPSVYETDSVLKYIVMEKMDCHLKDVMKKQNGNLTKNQQISIINLYKKLDEAKVFHGDANILNYMYFNNNLFIIDFGLSKKIDDKLIKKLGTSTPNMSIMLLGFVLKLKELKCPTSSYNYLITFLKKEDVIKFKI